MNKELRNSITFWLVVFILIAATIALFMGGKKNTDALFNLSAFDVKPEPDLTIQWPDDYCVSHIDPNAHTITLSPIKEGMKNKDSSKAGDGFSSLLSPKPSPANFEDLLDAIEFVESGGDPNAVGDNGEAVGTYQIHKIYIDDVNEILEFRGTDKQYTYADRWDRAKSREMTSIYIKNWKAIAEWNHPNRVPTQMEHFEAMARIHNGGPEGYKKESTKEYWEKVRARLESR